MGNSSQSSIILGKEKNEIYYFDSYQIIGHQLGSGPFGSVYPAVGKTKEQLSYCVLKISESQEYTLQNLKVREILKAYEIIKKLDHPNIVICYDAYVTSNNYFVISYERAPLGTLRDLILQSVQLNTQTIQYIALQLILGLEYIHSKGIIHGNIKPENILIFHNNKVKYTDFGFSMFVNNKNQYNSPEQKVKDYKIDYASDIFSLGVVLYELCYQRLPYKNEYISLTDVQRNAFTTINDHFKIDISYLRPQFDMHNLNFIIRHMLNPFPELRISLNKSYKLFKEENLNCINRIELEEYSIFRACIQGDLTQIKPLAQIYRRELEEKYTNGFTLLMQAAKYNPRVEVIQYLIKDCKCDINAKDNSGNTAFFHASYSNPSLDVIKYFVEVKKCNIKAQSKVRYSVLENAICGNSNIKIIHYLAQKSKCNMRAKNSFENTPLMLAACNNPNLKVIKYLIEHCQCDPTINSYCGDNILQLAVQHCQNVKILKYLISIHNWNLNIRDSDENTLLMLAAQKNTNLQIIKFLVEECSLNPKSIDTNRNNSLHLAAQFNPNLEIIQYFVEHCKFNLEDENTFSNNPLFLAAFNNSNAEIVKYLVYKYRREKIYCSANNIPGMLAAWNNTNLEVIKLLFGECNYNPHFRDDSQKSSLMLAAENNSNVEVIDYLINVKKCDLSLCDKDGNTPLLLAAQKNGNVEILKFLIKKCNCKVDVYNNDHFTAAMLATKFNPSAKVIRYLIEVCHFSTFWVSPQHGVNLEELARQSKSYKSLDYLSSY